MTTEEFRKLSAVAALLIPHDAAVLTLRSPDQLDVRLFLNADDADPNAQDDVSALAEADVGRLMTGEEARVRGFGAGVRIPLQVTNGTRGFLTLLARPPRTYGDDTLQKAQALADYIAAVLRHDDAVRRMSQDLLGLLTDVLDIRDVFPRVSEIVAAALPHDRLVLWLPQDQSMHVASNDDGPPIDHVKGGDGEEVTAAGFKLIGDLAREPGMAPPQHLLLPTRPHAATSETTDLNEVERRTIGYVMRETRGNKSRAAKRLGLTRTQLYGRLRKYGLDTGDS